MHEQYQADRPDDLTPEFIANSMREMQESGSPMSLFEVGLAGNYLWAKLEERGRDEGYRESKCMAMGQMAFSRSPWKAVEDVLAADLEGNAPGGGAKLAAVLLG